MNCKNGFWQYILIGLGSGALAALVSIILNYAWIYVAISGIATGAIIPLILWTCYLYNKRCAKSMRAEEKRTHLVRCEGWAQEDERDGWLFLTDCDLEFVPYRDGEEHIRLLLSDVKDVKAYINAIKIITEDECVELDVYRPFIWKRFILKAIGKR